MNSKNVQFQSPPSHLVSCFQKAEDLKFIVGFNFKLRNLCFAILNFNNATLITDVLY